MSKLRFPVWMKSIFLGFIILEVMTKIWSIVAVANIRSTPEIPWSFPLMLAVLWLTWKYLDGAWFPKSTQKTRHLWMRANRLRPGTRVWGWISAGLVGGAITQLILISTRLVGLPSGQIEQIERISIYPSPTVFLLIIMTSLVAGAVEEIAFRGYMQKPMELRYGPGMAIAVVALFFTLIHLPNATIAPHLIPLFFFGSLGWGILAYVTDSVLPGVVVHTLVDVLAYMWMWKNLDSAKATASANIIDNGIDFSFTILLIATFVTIAALAFSFSVLKRKMVESTA